MQPTVIHFSLTKLPRNTSEDTTMRTKVILFENDNRFGQNGHYYMIIQKPVSRQSLSNTLLNSSSSGV